MTLIDLRSDTVTLPTGAMRKAMAEARVGDDVFGEDPTVRLLEEMAADRLGKEAALYVSSGTMANLVSQMTHCGRGDEMILGDQSHIFFYEQGGSAAIGGIHPRTVPNRDDGTVDLDAVAAAVRADDVHFPRSRLLVLENTHNRCNGSPLDVSFMQTAGRVARRHGLAIHVDGARIFNAAVSLGRTPAELAAEADSISFCLSKGLCAPVGSLVCGTRDFIAKARRVRKVLGGGMRQAGVIAAAGVVALNEMVDRLAEDHENARRLAEGLCEIDGFSVAPDRVRTNIVFIGTAGTGATAADVVQRLKGRGVLCLASAPNTLRAVTHHPITRSDIEQALEAFGKAVN
ncbi:MAG: low-specificity L-threonine aldolase [Desulfobacterales bacterium]|jgi:threonine aldolase